MLEVESQTTNTWLSKQYYGHSEANKKRVQSAWRSASYPWSATPPSIISCWFAGDFYLHSWEAVIVWSSFSRWLMQVCYPGALQQNDNWPWNATVWRMVDKQSCSNYAQLLLQMKRIKANELHTGQHRGCLMKREGERQRMFVCLRHGLTILWYLITMSL